MQKKVLILLVSILPVLGGWQCNWRRYEFNWQTFRFEQVGMSNRRPAAQSKSPQELVKEQGQIPPKSTEPKQELSPKERRSLLAGRVYRLYLGRGDTNSGIPAENFVVIKYAPVDKLAELLSLVYPGEGPGGSVRLRFILYKDAEIWTQAKKFAKHIDVKVWRAEQTGQNDSDWQTAIGMIYASEFPRKLDPDVRFKIISRLNRIVSDPQIDSPDRWASAIIIAYLNSEYDPRDFTAANANLSLAGRIIRGREYQMLVVCYHQIRLMYERGERLQAKKLCQQSLDSFRALENTECYQSILNMLNRK